VSSRLRSRDSPENGIDLSGGFAGFIVNLVSDGGNYEAFIRTGSYESDGIEYVCDFSTMTKKPNSLNKSRNKFISVRLPFQNFRPVARKDTNDNTEEVEAFDGSDVRYIGFRYRSSMNRDTFKKENKEYSSFYIAFAYMKVYRRQAEPEFVYLSDARIPREVKNGMVRHDRRRLLNEPEDFARTGDSIQLLDQNTLQTVSELARSPEETYYKYRGEEILRKSGLR
jgi:hypothetical protein